MLREPELNISQLMILREPVLPQVDREFAARILASLAQVCQQSLPRLKTGWNLDLKLNHCCFSYDMTRTSVTLSFTLQRVLRKTHQFLLTGNYTYNQWRVINHFKKCHRWQIWDGCKYCVAVTVCVWFELGLDSSLSATVELNWNVSVAGTCWLRRPPIFMQCSPPVSSRASLNEPGELSENFTKVRKLKKVRG